MPAPALTPPRSCLGLQGEHRNGGRAVGHLRPCSWCTDLHLTSTQAARHLLLHHLAWAAACPSCPGAQGALTTHPCSLACPSCDSPCESRAALAVHMWKEHTVLYCELCQATLPTLGEMRAHLQEEEERLARSCVLCGKRLQGERLLDHLLKVRLLLTPL